MQFLAANWPWLAPVALVLVSSLLTGLTPYPRAKGVITGLRVVFDVLSFLTHNDSPGTLQWPLVERSTAPGSGDPPRAPPPAGAAALLLLLLPLVALAQACGPSVVDAARKSVAAADQIEIAGIEAFAKADLVRQHAIAEKGTLDARSQLDAYRASRTKIVDGFKLLADASHAARRVIDGLEAGQGGQLDLNAALGALLSAARALRDASALVGFTVPGLDQLVGGAP